MAEIYIYFERRTNEEIEKGVSKTHQRTGETT